MARSYGALKVSVWEPGNDFRALTPLAQWAYTMLLSQPQLSNLGVLPYTPEKWFRFAGGLTLPQLEHAIAELADHRFVIVDHHVGELLVRTFVKHDAVWKQPKLVTNARKLIREVESQRIRGYLTERHPWLVDDRSKQDIEEFEQSFTGHVDIPPETPSDTPIAETPIETPSDTHIPTRAGAGPGPGSGPGAAANVEEHSPRTEAHHDDPNDQDPAAAAHTEPVRASDIATTCQRLGADPRQVEPLARTLDHATYHEIVETVEERCRTGAVRNPAGLLIQLLREHDRATRTPKIHVPTVEQQIEAEARLIAATGTPLAVHIELLERKLRRLHVDETEWPRLIELATRAYTAAA